MSDVKKLLVAFNITDVGDSIALRGNGVVRSV